ncbi:MAG: hypothetical protein ACFFBX_09505, partial [Promethearchaeota archaeon]
KVLDLGSSRVGVPGFKNRFKIIETVEIPSSRTIHSSREPMLSCNTISLLGGWWTLGVCEAHRRFIDGNEEALR